MKQSFLGLTDEHIDPQFFIHQNIINDFNELVQLASKDGINITIISGYRSFEKQLKIWNDKALGIRPLLNPDGSSIDIKSLDAKSLVFKILSYSALPGLSRHHWGTDFDIYDKNKIKDNYEVQLIDSEYNADGIFNELNRWLESNLEQTAFFRPYLFKKGLIEVEKWHISHQKLAGQMATLLTIDELERCIQRSEIELKTTILEHIEEIFEQQFRVYL